MNKPKKVARKKHHKKRKKLKARRRLQTAVAGRPAPGR